MLGLSVGLKAVFKPFKQHLAVMQLFVAEFARMVFLNRISGGQAVKRRAQVDGVAPPFIPPQS